MSIQHYGQTCSRIFLIATSLYVIAPRYSTAADSSSTAEVNVPARVAETCESARAESVFEAGTAPKQLLEQGAGEGPAWHPQVGLVFSGEGRVSRLTAENKVETYNTGAATNGLMFDPQGRLVRCETEVGRVTRRTDLGRGPLEILTDNYLGKRYNQPNDMTIDSKGRIYFSDPLYGPRDKIQQFDETGKPVEGVYRIDIDGKTTRIISHEADRPNGVLVSLEDRYLYVADNNNNTVNGARLLWRFDLNSDGTIRPESRKLIHDWGTGRGPDGMAQDQAGRLYVAGGLNKPNPPYETVDDNNRGGIYVFDAEGRFLEFVAIPRDEVTNCAFGGDDLKTLYITAGGSLWSVRTVTAGVLP